VAVRVGIDVGGTFTKAVACVPSTGQVVARSIVPTTHATGIAEGVVATLSRIVQEVKRLGAGPIALVAHSSTQAVNALLEGDTAPVGVLGIGRRPDLRRAKRRTRVGEVRLAPGRRLRTIHGFLDGTGGLDRTEVDAALDQVVDRGATALAVSEAFGVEDPSGERMALKAAADRGLPACGGHELSGLYGLETRTVTAALNASILPVALDTASTVEEAVARDASDVPILVMRGDGGAADLSTMRRRPLLTAFSGPAASVAGALRHLRIRDGVVVEVGGTSTNVSVVRGGRPVLSYVRVLDHVTFVRSLDVRVSGVAGGSLLRVGRGGRIVEVGPRSAHIAGLPYCSFTDPDELDGATAELAAPRPGDPPAYAVVTAGDLRCGLTLTCAANATGDVPEGTYARGNPEAAQAGFEALGRLTGRDPDALARDAADRAARRIAEIVGEAAAEHELREPVIVGLGGGAGAVIPRVAQVLGVRWEIPPEAEVISSIGDALSLVRAEVERGMVRPSSDAVAGLIRDAEEAAVAAGASPSSLQVETQAVPERRALRAVALGAAPLDDSSDGERASEEVLSTSATALLGEGTTLVARNGFYAVFASGRRYAVLDHRGSVAAEGEGVVLSGPGDEVADALERTLPGLVRRFGPVGVAPAVRLVRGPRLVDLSLFSSPEGVLEAAAAECRLADGEPMVALVSRS
jgi:N-methylhydantoinase A